MECWGVENRHREAWIATLTQSLTSWVVSDKLLNLFAKGRCGLKTSKDHFGPHVLHSQPGGLPGGVGLKLWVLERGGGRQQ